MRKSYYILMIILLINLLTNLLDSYAITEKKSNIKMIIQKGHAKGISSISFSLDGKYIAAGGEDGILRLWSRDGKFIRSFIEHSISGIKTGKKAYKLKK